MFPEVFSLGPMSPQGVSCRFEKLRDFPASSRSLPSAQLPDPGGNPLVVQTAEVDVFGTFLFSKSLAPGH